MTLDSLKRRLRGLLLPTAERIVYGGKTAGEMVPTKFPPGHFHSPLPSMAEVQLNEPGGEPAGIDLRLEQQAEVVTTLDLGARPGARFDDGWFSSVDAAVLRSLIGAHQPNLIIEVGSGWSTAAMLDAGHTNLVLIEPNPERLQSVLTADELGLVQLLRSNVQEVPSSTFERLQSGDFLFIDSSHVAKHGSDVNRVLFEILPALPPGVLVHFHDVYYPFTYPAGWLREGRAWNEAYALRAFLEFNAAFAIELWLSALRVHRPDLELPPGDSSSIWIRRL
jgi:predicted O-methyltransferase YrrM